MTASHLAAAPRIADGNPDVRVRDVKVLSDQWYVLRKYSLDVRRSDGVWRPQEREAYDRGNGAAILLYNRAAATIVLTRQFRLPAYVNGVGDGMLIEAPAGLLDDLSPAECIRKETVEETGFDIAEVTQVFDAFMSPGAVTERLHLFIAEYGPGDRAARGGGNEAEGEDIEVLEISFEEALAMIGDGRIRDAKTIILIYHLRIRGIL